jgi:hypothetical protein
MEIELIEGEMAQNRIDVTTAINFKKVSATF